MAEVVEPKNVQTEIPLEALLVEVMKKKEADLRFDQAHVVYANGKFELSYSFSDDDAYRFENLRVIIDLTEEVPSITRIYPCAFLYENEMRELFGVKIEMISLDYKDKLYRLNEVNPMLPEAGKKLMAEEQEKCKADGGEQ